MSPKLKPQIGLFGSSFNPPHLGHLAVLKDLCQKKLFDGIWLLPVFHHPFGKSLAPYETRLHLTHLLQEEIASPQIKICEIEKELDQKPSYMIDSIRGLQKKFPGFKFTLILGSDCQKELASWHESTEIKKSVELYFIPRAGLEKSPYPNVSSSEIREKLTRGEDVKHLTTKKIANYLEKNKVYKNFENKP